MCEAMTHSGKSLNRVTKLNELDTYQRIFYLKMGEMKQTLCNFA